LQEERRVSNIAWISEVRRNHILGKVLSPKSQLKEKREVTY